MCSALWRVASENLISGEKSALLVLDVVLAQHVTVIRGRGGRGRGVGGENIQHSGQQES